METGVGDRLARGWPSATFRASDGNVTAQQWDEAVGSFSLEEYMKGGKKPETGKKETTRV